MATVPVYDSPTVAAAPLPGPIESRRQIVYQTDEPAQRATKSGQEMMQLAQVVQDNTDEAKAKERFNAYQQTIEYALHNPDPDSPGYLNKTGAAAVNGYNDVKDSIPKPADFADGLSGRQAAMFTNVAQQHYASTMQTVDQHAAQQSQVYNVGQTKAMIENQMPAIANNYIGGLDGAADTHPIEFKNYSTAIGTMLNSVQQLNHLTDNDSPAAMQEAQAAVLSQMHSSVVASLLSKNSPDAQNYFQQHEAEMSIRQQDTLRVQLNNQVEQNVSLGLARQLATQFPDDAGAQHRALQFMMDEAGKTPAGQIIDAKMYKATSSEIDYQHVLFKQQQEEDTKQALGTAQQFLLDHRGASINDLPNEIYSTLKDSGHLPALTSFARNDVTSDPKAVFNISNHFGDGSALDIANKKSVPDSDWFNMRSLLSQKDFEYWDKQRSNQINGTLAAKDDPGNVSTAILRDAFNSRLAGIGVTIPTAKSSTDDKATAGARWQYAQQYLIDAQKASGRRFDKDEIASTMNELFAKDVAFRKEHMFGAFTTDADERMLALKDVPEPAKTGITNALKASGNKNPTNTDILMQYWKMNGK